MFASLLSASLLAPTATQDVFLPKNAQVVQPVSAAQVSPRDEYEPQCQSPSDFGWPRFESVDDLRASKWAAYFMDVYGELPEHYPVCIYDLWGVSKDAFERAGIDDHVPKALGTDDLQDGDFFIGGTVGLMIYHSTYEPAPSNTWIEITHVQVPTEISGMWCWRLRGSGIWFNTGNTVTFPNDNHATAIQTLQAGCSAHVSMAWPRLESDIFGACAREKGYDSVQLEPQSMTPVSTWGQAGLTELVITGLDGKYNCGTADGSQTTLRSGWMASHQCDCEAAEAPPKCGISNRAPLFPYLGYSDPPLCAAQTGLHFWVECDPSQCVPTSCKIPSKVSQIARLETHVEIQE